MEATAVTATPILVTASAVRGAQRTARSILLESLRALYNVAVGSVMEMTGSVRDIVKASPHVLRSMVTISERSLRELAKYSAISLRTFLRVVERATGSPESIIVAVVMYRLVDYAVNISPADAVRFLDDVKLEVLKISVAPVTVTLPRVDLSAWRRGVREFFSAVVAHFQSLKVQLQVPEPERVSLGCGAPPEWHDVPGQIRYGLCVLGEAIVNALLRLGYYIVSLAVTVARIVLDFLSLLLEFTGRASELAIALMEWIANAVLWLVELIANGAVKAVALVVNVVLSLVVKPLVSVFVDYVLKPLAVFIVSAYNWIKSSMKACLCWYLRVSPFAVAFRLAHRYIARRLERKGFTSIGELLRFGVLGVVGVMASSVLATSILLYTIVPECGLVPGLEPTIEAPQPPQPLALETIPMTHHSLLALSVSAVETREISVRAVYTAVLRVRVRAEDTITAVTPRLHFSELGIRIKAEETTRGVAYA